MTKQEHLLIITLFTKQMQFIKILVNLLKSNGIATQDDVNAFGFATALDMQSNLALFRDASTSYVQLAKGLGIETGIEIP
jgi:hypothetical protein